MARAGTSRRGKRTQCMGIEVTKQVQGFGGWHYVYQRHDLIPNDVFRITTCGWYVDV